LIHGQLINRGAGLLYRVVEKHVDATEGFADRRNSLAHRCRIAHIGQAIGFSDCTPAFAVSSSGSFRRPQSASAPILHGDGDGFAVPLPARLRLLFCASP
jgi:hypothetical protein